MSERPRDARRRRRAAVVVAVAVLLAATTARAEHTVYQARHRPAEELAELVRPLLAGGGVAVDARTNSLVLTGDPAAIRAALAVLAKQDRPPRQVRIEVRFTERSSLDEKKLAAGTAVRTGSFWIATSREEPTRGGLHIEGTAQARHLTTGRRADQFLVLAEGGEGVIVTGRSVPVTRWLAGYSREVGERIAWEGELRAETGFTISPRILDGGRVLLTITPRAEYLSERGRQEVVYRNASTTITVAEGEWVTVAGGDEESGRLVSGMLSGLATEDAAQDWAMVLRVSRQ